MGEAIVTGVISGVVAGIIVPILWGAVQWVIRRRNSDEFKIELKRMPSKIGGYKVKFGVLHVQNDDETIRNTVHWFEKIPTGELYVAIRHPRNLGFQYKCFVDSKCNLSQISTYLTGKKYKNKYKDISGGSIPNRFWFILAKNQIAEDYRGNVNNYYYPV